jgi:CBS domain-containing protein
MKVKDVIHKGAEWVAPQTTLADVARLPVVNDKKRLVGMLSFGDIAHAGSHELSGEVTTAVSAHHA